MSSLVKTRVGVRVGVLGMLYICPGPRIRLCLGADYFVIVGVGVLGCALCHTYVSEQQFGSAWEQIILSPLMWACVGVHVGVLGMLYICPGAGILLCLGAKYFVNFGVGMLGSTCRSTAHSIFLRLSQSRYLARLQRSMYTCL